MKCIQLRPSVCKSERRSREGAWIEIVLVSILILILMGRSREGAWIEILFLPSYMRLSERRSREGAWIEIAVGLKY